MMRHLVLAAAVGLGCAAAARATAEAAGPQRGSPTPQITAVNQAEERPVRGNDELVRTDMHRVIDLKLNDVPLSGAIDRLRGITGVRISVNWKALEAAGVRRGEPVSLRLERVHASTALDLLLRVASPESPRLGWRVDEGVVSVSTAEDLNKNVEIRLYDIRDLIGKSATLDERTRKVNAIVRLLQDRIDPASWRQHGGAVGAMRELQGQLIVTQTPENHRAITDLIESVRRLTTAGVR